MFQEIKWIDGLVGDFINFARLTDRSGDRPFGQTLDAIDLLDDVFTDATFEVQTRRTRVSYEREASFIVSVISELICGAIGNIVRNAVNTRAISLGFRPVNGWMAVSFASR
jgi:nitrogen fixation/metabolism regulation signal transduction histidine kinase